MQQVNLYTLDLRPKKELLSAERCVIAAILLVVGIIVLTLLDRHELQRLNVRADQLEAHSKQIEKDVQALKSQPAADLKIDLDSEIKRVRVAIHNRKQIEALLSGRRMGNKTGFSEFFDALSASVPNGVRLREFGVVAGGQQAYFVGESQAVKSIPEFFDRLQHTPAFEKTTFGTLRIEEKENKHIFAIGPEAMVPQELVFE